MIMKAARCTILPNERDKRCLLIEPLFFSAKKFDAASLFFVQLNPIGLLYLFTP
jgi:hypothetical protein